MSIPHASPTGNPRLTAALDYLARGWSPLALEPGGKKPPGQWKAFTKQLPTEAQLRAAWNKHPDANVGVALGPVSGLIGLDIDGPEGEDLLAELAGEHSINALAFSTPNAGLRLLYALAPGEDLPIKSWKNAKGNEVLRVLARGSQTVMPPSTLASGEYCWLEECALGVAELALRPDWLPPLLVGSHLGKDDQGGAKHDSAWVHMRARKFLEKCDPCVSGQGGSPQAYKIACKMVHGFHLDTESACGLIWQHYNPHCQPPWSEKEWRHHLENAKKHGSSKDYLGEGKPKPPGHGPDRVPPSKGHAPQAPKADNAAPATNCTPFANIPRRKVEWLWPAVLPEGKFAICDGDPGLGKSTVLLDLAARVSTDAIMPDDSQGLAGNVLILSAEDNPEDTVGPRLAAASANMNKVFFLDEIDGRPPVIPHDLPHIEKLLEQHHIRLLILDPLVAFLACDSNKDQEVRRALTRLKKVLGRRRCTAIGLRHLNKAGGTKAIYRGGGTIGIIGAARTGILIAKHPDDPHKCVLALTKKNLSAGHASLTYRLVYCPEHDACQVEWIKGECSFAADQLLRPPPDDDDKADKEDDAWKLQAATDLLQHLLENGTKFDKGTKISQGEAFAEAKAVNISPRTLQRAAKNLGLKYTWTDTPNSEGRVSFWYVAK